MTLAKQLERFTPGYHMTRMGQGLRLMLSPMRRMRMNAMHKALTRYVETVVDELPKVRTGEDKVEAAYWVTDTWERADAYVWTLGNHAVARVAGQITTDIQTKLVNKLVLADIFLRVVVEAPPFRVEIRKETPDRVFFYDHLPMIKALPINEMVCVPGVVHKMRTSQPAAFKLSEHVGTAASTRSGKTGLARVGLMSLAILNDPAHLAMLIVDPGVMDMAATDMRFLPHLAHPIVTDPDEAVMVVAGAMQLLDQRRQEVAAAIGSGQRWQPPCNVLVYIDEIAGLMHRNPKVMQWLVYLAQEGLKYGIFLWWATQRCTVDVINGHLRGNTNVMWAGRVRDAGESNIVAGRAGVACHDQSPTSFKFMRDNRTEDCQSYWLTTDQVNELVPLIAQKWQGVALGWRLQFAQPEVAQAVQPPPVQPAVNGRPKADDAPIVDYLVQLVQAGESLDNIGINFISKKIGPQFNNGQELGKDRAKRIKQAVQNVVGNTVQN